MLVHASRRAACVIRASASGGTVARPGGGVGGPFRAALKTYRNFEQDLSASLRRRPPKLPEPMAAAARSSSFCGGPALCRPTEAIACRSGVNNWESASV